MQQIRLVLFCLILTSVDISAQDDSARVFGMNVTGSLRGRVEYWDWFRAPPAQSAYTYGAGVLRLNLGGSSRRWEWRADGSFPVFLHLPDRAEAPDPAGPLGYGGDYFQVNRKRDIGAAVLRQAFIAFKNSSGGLKLRIGRFEFADGAEAVPADPILAELKRERVNQRLVGIFNYALRSFDGAELSYQQNRSNVTAVAARIVEGSFRLRALKEIGAEFAYGAYTRYLPARTHASEMRLFGLYYQDRRGTRKVDNRPLSSRETERGPIRLITPGLHFISTIKAGPGAADFVLWAAGQFGRWGPQSHRAAEIAAEAGYLFPSRFRPWLRAGYFRSTGDNHPEDDRHGTFFQVLSSPRAYARFPFYVLMNVEDVFVQFKTSPARRWSLRPEFHAIRLSSAKDLWYDGGGAFEDTSFGYLGRPSGEKRQIGVSFDISADYAAGKNTTVSLYAGIGRGGAVPAFVFPAGGTRPAARLMSIEIVRRF